MSFGCAAETEVTCRPAIARRPRLAWVWSAWPRTFVVAALLLVRWLGPAYAASTPDPCASITARSSAVINQVSATTTSLVALNATHAIYVCGFTIAIAGSGTSASTAQFEYGTGAACSSPTALTGTLGAGTATATVPFQVSYGDGGHTIFTVPPGSGLCVVSTGTTINNQGVVTYVQGTGNTFP
jgi:hypothetical protein